MRGCERGAGSANRAPAHAHTITDHSGQDITDQSEQDITYHGHDAITDHSEQDITHHSDEAITDHSEHAIFIPNRHNTLKYSLCEKTTRLGKEAILSHSGKTKIWHSDKSIFNYNTRKITTDTDDAIVWHSDKSDPSYNKFRTRHTESKISKKQCRCTIEGIEVSRRSSGTAISKHSGETILPRRTRGGAILLCVLLLLTLRGSSGSASLGAQLVCARAPLTEKQRALCRASPAAMAAIATGLRMAYEECRSQLSGRRWNCSGVGDGTHFGHVMPLATREAAFTYAITSAGVTHALSAACARGELPACGCAHRRRSVPGEQWEWSGVGAARCGEAAYGARLARRFLDARELERDARAVMNLHNNRLGRKMVKELVRRECKCHGVSGSCAVRTCWRALPPFHALGAALRDKYQRAKLVTPVERGTSVDGRVNIQLIVKRPRHPGASGRLARKSEMVFLAPSPTYCEPDAAAGSFGTHARICNNTSKGEDGCESLCCGRGYSTVRRTERVQCRCQFQWCCRVRCHSCLTRTEHHICN